MTNTFDFPLMSVSALYRHTSSRSSLTEIARSALFYESKCISKNKLVAKSTMWRSLKQHVLVQHVPFIANYSLDKNQEPLSSLNLSKYYNKNLYSSLKKNNQSV